METVRHDLQFAFRLLWKDRAFSVTALLTLAICLAANVAIFSVVRAVLLRPLPFPDAERLVLAYEAFPGAGVARAGTSIPNYFDREAYTDTFESQALYRPRGVDVGEAGRPERVGAFEVTPSFFRVLRTGAAHGRVFAESEGLVGGPAVAVLASGFAGRLFGSPAAAVGRTLPISGEPRTVVGVMPPGFAFLDPDVQIWLPARFTAEQRADEARYSQNHDTILRLAPGATLARAQARLDAQTARNIEQAGPVKPLLINAGHHVVVVPLADDLVRHVRPALHLLWGGALLVLLIAAANIINLTLVRATGRLKELATRQALGAGYGRVARQLLTETVLLAGLGGLTGLAMGAGVLTALPAIGLADVPRAHEVGLDWAVVAFALGLSLLLGLLVGAGPLVQLTGLRLNAVLQEEGRGSTGGRGSALMRRALVMAQVTLAFVLLTSAGLLLASFRHVLAVHPGFTATHVLTARIGLPAARYPDAPRATGFLTRMLAQVRALPGVEAAGITTALPFAGDADSSVVIPEGQSPAPNESVVSPNQVRVSTGYFEALGIPLRRGRLFTDADTADAPRVVIVDERLAQHFWPGRDPVGRRLYVPQTPDDVARPGPTVIWLEVVGVVGSVKLHGLQEGEGARVGAYYFPMAQDYARGWGLVIRTTRDTARMTAAVRRAVAAVDPELPVFDVMPMPQRIERSLDRRRTPMVLAVAFGAVALLLACVGLYGVLAYQVAHRTREIGIRMTLGSDAAGILRLVLREGGWLVAGGLAAGLAGTLGLRRVLAAQLFGVGAFDAGVLVAVCGVLGLAALAACLGPALRAARIDPAAALARR